MSKNIQCQCKKKCVLYAIAMIFPSKGESHKNDLVFLIRSENTVTDKDHTQSSSFYYPSFAPVYFNKYVIPLHEACSINNTVLYQIYFIKLNCTIFGLLT